jgi:hypothetical protein
MPIPVFVFEGTVRWPTIHDNVLQVFPGDRNAYRFWLRRWDPEGVFEAYAAVRDRGAAAASASSNSVEMEQRNSPLLTRSSDSLSDVPRPSQTAPLPKFVADALITAAVVSATTCPITMEPIKNQTAAVTSCFHVFDATAIASWFVNNTTCPTCKQPAHI